MLRYAAGRRDIFLTILAISWFWLIGAAFLAEIAPFAKDVLGGDENLATLFLVTFSVGMALGSLLCNSMLKGQVHATFVPLGALGMTVFIVDLYFASRNGLPGGAASLSAFLDQFRRLAHPDRRWPDCRRRRHLYRAAVRISSIAVTTLTAPATSPPTILSTRCSWWSRPSAPHCCSPWA